MPAFLLEMQMCFTLMRKCLYCLALQNTISVLVNLANMNGLGLGCVGMVSYPSLGCLVLADSHFIFRSPFMTPEDGNLMA